MATIPWKMIIDISLPTLIEQASKLFKKADISAQAATSPPPAHATVDEKIEVLASKVEQVEILEAQQAKLLLDTLTELRVVSVRAAGLQARANAAVIVSAVSLISSAAIWLVK